MNVLETPRLALRQFTTADAAFVLQLVNEPAWLRFIGDRGVRTLADAEEYLRKGPVASYTQNGFGLWLVARQTDGVPLGMCGLIRRPTLPDIDLGFAILEKFHGHGYASECAAATRDFARDQLGLKRIVAITSPDNSRSIRLLEKLGLHYERMVRLTPTNEVKLFAIEF